MSKHPIFLLGVVALCACADSSDGVVTEYGDRYAISRQGADGLATELRATADDALLATMSIAADGTAAWSRDGMTQPIQTEQASDDLVARASGTTTAMLPGDELTANDLLYHLDVATPVAPDVASVDCEAHDYDNMLCVTCRDGEYYCYHCTWVDPWGNPSWYMQCSGGGGGKDPYHDSP